MLDDDPVGAEPLGRLGPDRLTLTMRHRRIGVVVDPRHGPSRMLIAHRPHEEGGRPRAGMRDLGDQRRDIDRSVDQGDTHAQPPATGGMIATSSPARITCAADA